MDEFEQLLERKAKLKPKLSYVDLKTGHKVTVYDGEEAKEVLAKIHDYIQKHSQKATRIANST